MLGRGSYLRVRVSSGKENLDIMGSCWENDLGVRGLEERPISVVFKRSAIFKKYICSRFRFIQWSQEILVISMQMFDKSRLHSNWVPKIGGKSPTFFWRADVGAKMISSDAVNLTKASNNVATICEMLRNMNIFLCGLKRIQPSLLSRYFGKQILRLVWWTRKRNCLRLTFDTAYLYRYRNFSRGFSVKPSRQMPRGVKFWTFRE